MRQIILFAASWMGIILAQRITIKGRVTDETTREPLIGAKIIISDGQTGALTDTDGRFEVQVDRAPSVKVQVTYEGYEDKVLTLSLPADKTEITADIPLLPKNTTIQEVVVSAARYEQKIEQVSVSMDFVKPRQVENLASVDPIKALEQTPGVSTNKDQPSIRGSSGYTYGAGSRVLLLLDGLPMMSPDRLSTQFDLIPVDNIKQIEIVKGASSVLYGTGALGGIINVVSEDVKFQPRTVVRLQHQIFDSPRPPVGDWDGRSSASISAAHILHAQRVDNWEVAALLDLIRDTGFRKEGFSNRARTWISIKHNAPFLDGLQYGVSLQANIDSSATYIAWDSFPDRANLPGSGFLTYQMLQRYMIDPFISYLTPKGHRHWLRGRHYRTVNDLSTPQSGGATLHYYDYQYVHNLQKWGKVIVGGNYTENRVYAKEVFGKARGRQAAAFAQAEIDLWKFHLSAGIRYQYEDIRGDTSIQVRQGQVVKGETPKEVELVTIQEPVFRGGITFTPFQGTILRASFGQGLRSPSVAERFTTTGAGGITVVPNPLVKVERGYSAEVGLRQYIKVGETFKGFIDISAFRMEFKDMVEFQVNTAAILNGYPGLPFSAVNLSRAFIQGLEPLWGLRYEKGKFYANLSGGLTLIDPVNPDGSKALDTMNNTAGAFTVINTALQLPPKDDPRYNIANDIPYTLKYRNKQILRGILEVGYGNFSFTTNFRYSSGITNVDKLFFLLGALNPDQLAGLEEFYRDYASKPYTVWDFILAYEVGKTRWSFHIFNAFNRIYTTLPGTLNEQRSFALQAVVKIQ
ncbi:MAG: TonB-dependent receptor [Bacteroidia bacterium]|nr:TonB-dependent receptor [Bacteroidia bacterium]MCX7651260.1 TonB-dependent receptor [Bacteroidia bacterium]MDW8416208.1 TonB-dependent receptor [Bacteroidia bacterium]